MTISPSISSWFNLDANVDQDDFKAWGESIEGEMAAVLASASYVFATKAELDAFLAVDENVRAEVVADSTPANNGTYRKVGASGVGSWTQVSTTGIYNLDSRLDPIEVVDPVNRLPTAEALALVAAPTIADPEHDLLWSSTDSEGALISWVDDVGNFRSMGEHDMPGAIIESGLPYIYTGAGDKVQLGTDELTPGTADITPKAVTPMRGNRVAVTQDKPLKGLYRQAIHGPTAGKPPVLGGRVLPHFAIKGQSNAAGSSGGAGGDLYQIPAAYWPRNCLMPNRQTGTKDIRGGLSGQTTATLLTANDFDGLTPILEMLASSGGYGQTIAAGFAAAAQYEAKTYVGIPHRFSMFCDGVGSQAYSALAQGTNPYNNGKIGLQVANETARNAGYSCVCPAVFLLHGEADVGSATYSADLDTWRDDCDTDFKTTTSQEQDVVFYMGQPSSFILSNNSGSHVQMVERMLLDPDHFTVVAPYYPFWADDPNDLLHLTHRQKFDLGYYFWKAWRDHDLLGFGWKPTHATSTTRIDGNTFDINWHSPVGAITIDTTLVTDPNSQNGLRVWSAADSNIVISSITMTGDTTTRVVTSDALQTDSQLWIGLNAQAVTRDAANLCRCNFRDSDPTVSLIDGAPLYNWAAHQRISIPN